MAQLITLQVLGAASGQAASAESHFATWGQVLALWSGVAPAGHTHAAADLTGFDAAVQAVVEGMALSGAEALVASGGLMRTVEGLRVDSGVVSLLGHTHAAGEVVGFAEGVQGLMPNTLLNGDSIWWTWYDGLGEAEVRPAVNGGLVVGYTGLGCDFGTGSAQVARGNHTHAQLHAALSFQSSATMTLGLADQVASLEVKLASGGGLRVESGVRADFGTGASQVARGNHTHAQLHDAVTVQSSAGLTLQLSGQQLTGAPVCDATPDAGAGRVVLGSRGLAVALGSASDTAAAGNHTHAEATVSASGLMSAADKLWLDLLRSRYESGVWGGAVQVVTFARDAAFVVGEYLLGSPSWPTPMVLLSAELVAWAGQEDSTVLTLEVGGVLTGHTITLPAGTAGSEVLASTNLSSLALAAGDRVRWKITAGPAVESGAWKAQLALRVKPA